ncbi:MAG TPA: phosphatase PAP2 family protein [Bacteroidales bacterium]|nr:phosphatase PAP2 family protein [Bacteroidales bacterium]
MSGKIQSFRLLAVEKAAIAYLLITFLFIIFSGSRLDNNLLHLVMRGSIITVILFLPFLEHLYDRPRLIKAIRIFFPFVLLPFLYNETDYLNNVLFTNDLDPFFSGLESTLFGTQPSLEFAAMIHSDLFADLMYFGYFSYYCLAIGIPLYIYFKTGTREGEQFAFVIIASFLFYYLVYIILPVAGPQFYYANTPAALPDGYVFGPLMRFISAAGEGRTAAFPSSHVSICLMLLYGCFRYARTLMPLVLPVAVLLLLSTVYLRAHYAIDVIAGMIATPPVWLFSVKLFKTLNQGHRSVYYVTH